MAAIQQPQHKTLSAVLSNVMLLPDEYDVAIRDLAIDSRQIQPGDLFLAIQGERVNGADYIESAIDAGASAVLWDAPEDTISFAWSAAKNKIPLIAVTNLKENLSELVTYFYNAASELLDIVAVTGTNGKTSCVNYIAQALGTEKKCGLIGTLGTGIYPNILSGTHTTPDVLSVHKTLANFVEHDVRYAAIEVSSHALAQGRVDGVNIDTAIFTNLTQDHLDYHATMQAYFNEKLKLFQRSSLKTAIINLDDPYGIAVVNAVRDKNIITYSLDVNKKADVFASNIKYERDATDFILNVADGCIAIRSKLIGDFNVSNLLAVCAYLRSIKYSLEEIAQSVEKIQSVAGRMQKILADGFPVVIIDYAHTPDALEKALKTLVTKCGENLTCVFGCGGERDKAKRKKMGAVAERYAMNIVLTNDNPRGEDAAEIIRQIMSGIKDQKKVHIELDREKAINTAISKTDLHGSVLVAGKGHENYQIIGSKKIKFNDASVVKKFMSK